MNLLRKIVRSKGDPKILQSGPSSLDQIDRLSRGLDGSASVWDLSRSLRRAALRVHWAWRARKRFCGPVPGQGHIAFPADQAAQPARRRIHDLEAGRIPRAPNHALRVLASRNVVCPVGAKGAGDFALLWQRIASLSGLRCNRKLDR